jgi:hypothetical protein
MATAASVSSSRSLVTEINIATEKCGEEAATPAWFEELRYKISLLQPPWRDKKIHGLRGAGKHFKAMKQIEKPDFNARMKLEMISLQRNIKAAETGYGESLFNLTVARSYIKKLLGNAKIAAYFKVNHPDIFSEFKAIATAEIL